LKTSCGGKGLAEKVRIPLYEGAKIAQKKRHMIFERFLILTSSKHSMIMFC